MPPTGVPDAQIPPARSRSYGRRKEDQPVHKFTKYGGIVLALISPLVSWGWTVAWTAAQQKLVPRTEFEEFVKAHPASQANPAKLEEILARLVTATEKMAACTETTKERHR